MKKGFTFIAVALILVVVVTGYGRFEVLSKENTTEAINESYLAHVDVDYAYQIAKNLEEFKTNEKLGYRTAGSEAEIKTGNAIYDEMIKLGLAEVTRDPFTIDKWEFEKADMLFTDQDGNEHLAVLAGYQTNFVTDGFQEFEIVYAQKGTKHDLADLDVADKLVLVDINQRDEWWVTFPAYQAYLHGAAAVIVVQEEGYGEVDPAALNTQDICGPDFAPAFSMSQADAGVLKEIIDASESGSAVVRLDAKSIVTFDQETFNYHGKIIGKDPDSYIILSAHYDSYFAGFQDDNAAIGLLLGIAKGLIDSNYQPEKTLIFLALAAEEWGVSDTRYDWSTGAYNQIFRVRPEWAGKAVINLNFELPAFEHTTADEIRASYELKNYLEQFAPTVPQIDGVYEDGISVVAPSRTWSDDFSFSIAGIPALRNDFQDSEFMRTHYHSQFDNSDTYNEKALEFHLNLYGLLTIYYDRTAVVPLDFTVRLDALKDSINEDVFELAGVSPEELIAEIDQAMALAASVNDRVQEINTAYTAALLAGDTQLAAQLYNNSRALNQGLLQAFLFAEDNLLKLTWEDEPIFPHEHGQNNVENLSLALEALENGDIQTAIDEYLWQVDNNWYAYDFSKEVYRYFTDQVLEQPVERLLWGTGRIMGHEDLYDPVNSLLEKYEDNDVDVSEEIEVLQNALERQKQILKESIVEEIASVRTLGEILSKLN